MLHGHTYNTINIFKNLSVLQCKFDCSYLNVNAKDYM